MHPSKRKTLFISLFLLLMFCVFEPSFAATDTLNVQVDGKAVQFEAITTGNLVFISARDMANLFHADLAYDASEKEVTLKTSKVNAVLRVGSSSVTLNHKKVALDASPMIVDNTSYIPLKAAKEIWGASYGWNEQTLYIRTDGKEVQVPAVEKVFVKEQIVSVGGKNTPVSYILVPKSSGLHADVILAQNTVGQTESLRSLARRSSAKAAINGSYFQSYDSSKSQEPYGLIIKSGNLLHAENTGSVIAFTSSNIKMDIVRSVITASVGGTHYSVSLFNHTPNANSNTVVLYNSAYGNSTNCALGTSVTVQNGEIVSIVSKQPVNIPSNGYVLLFTGEKATTAQKFKKGTKVSYSVRYTNGDSHTVDFSDVKTAVGAGPLLLKDGNNIVNPEREGFSDSTGFSMTVTRSAIGVTADSDILLVGDVKCTLEQLASIMSQLGAKHAICMDSGSSSGLYVPGAALSAPAKDISNALIFK